MESLFCTKCRQHKDEKSVIVNGLHHCKSCAKEEEAKLRQAGHVDYIEFYFGGKR